MLKTNYSYKSISENLQNSKMENSCLDKQAILSRITEDLPLTPWTDIKILNWLPEDDQLPIEYCFYTTPFGEVLAANTPKGICYLGLVEINPEDVLADFKKRFRHLKPTKAKTSLQKQAVNFLDEKINELLKFHLKGTYYQTEIWRKLLRIPYGKVISYSTLAGSNHYSRAAGTANGRNPIFYIIPCHRVVNTSGAFNHYFWGKEVKKRLLAWEFANSSI